MHIQYDGRCLYCIRIELNASVYQHHLVQLTSKPSWLYCILCHYSKVVVCLFFISSVNFIVSLNHFCFLFLFVCLFYFCLFVCFIFVLFCFSLGIQLLDAADITCPNNIVQYADVGQITTSVTWPPPVTSPDTVQVVSTHDPGQVFFVGLTNIVYVALDVAGDSATCGFVITVISKYLGDFCGFYFEYTFYREREKNFFTKYNSLILHKFPYKTE